MRRIVVLLGVLVLAAPAQGAMQDREQLDRVEARQKDQERRRDELRAEARVLRREIDGLRDELVRLARAQAGSEREAGVQRARFERLNAREAELTGRMSRNRTELTRLLSALQLYTRDPPPALLVSPGDANDAVRAAILMRAVTPELEKRAAALKAEALEITRLRREAAIAGEALITAESAVADRRAEIERLLTDKAVLEARLYAEASGADREARALAAQAEDLRAFLRGLTGRSQQADGNLRGPERSGRFGARARWSAPVAGEVSQRFGGKSEGWTWRTEPAAQVLSPDDGRVEYAGPLKGWDQVVVIRLGDGFHLVLAGMETVAVGTGRSVAAGEPVGRMSDRRDPPPELYMEMRRQGAPVDPARWLDAERQP